jgi:hypothetical protein
LDLYQIKENLHKTHPLYTVSKLLLNSLYGRFGMDFELQFISNRIVTNDEIIDLMENNTNISEVLDLENSKSLITVLDENKLEDSNHDTSSGNISIGIASAVTSYARIYMSEIKMKYKDHFYYSDTDSAFLDCELDSKYLGSGLGK